ncbi:DUF4326 domain-containing protein [Streptomyces tendae]|uniref:DUF4326 domain-containing protein n=1 Tax=Streptomyces tendae TaxID=1932 RepID=UPI00382BDE6A
MSTPVRIQRRTKGWRAPQGAVYVGRPTRFGNPFRLVTAPHGGYVVVHDGSGAGVGTFATAVEARRYATDGYRVWVDQPEQKELRLLIPQLLHGRDLTCWCPAPAVGQPDHCHAAVLLQLANEEAPL